MNDGQRQGMNEGKDDREEGEFAAGDKMFNRSMFCLSQLDWTDLEKN